MKNQAIELLRTEYLNHAPNGFFETRKAHLTDNIHVYVGLVKNLEDCPYRIRENDKGFGVFTISDFDGGLKLELGHHYLSCKPDDPRYAMSHKKVSYRVIKAKSANDLRDKFGKYLNRFFSMVREQIANDNLYQAQDIKSIYVESIR